MSRTGKVVVWLAFASCVYLTAEAFLPPDRQPTAQLSIAAIHAYQATGSQSMAAWGVHCRYTPSCSHYAVDAIRAYGTLDGLVRTAGRLWRCSPWGGSGYDPAVEPHAAAFLEPQAPQAPQTSQNPQETPEQRRARELQDQRTREAMEKLHKDLRDLQKEFPEAGKNAGKAAGACLGGCLMGILLKIILPGHFVLAVVLLILVLNDAKARGDTNLPLWVVLVFFLSWIGAIIYFVQRKKGDLTPCPNCRQNRLSTLAKCPHCGAESGAPKPPDAAPGPAPSKT